MRRLAFALVAILVALGISGSNAKNVTALTGARVTIDWNAGTADRTDQTDISTDENKFKMVDYDSTTSYHMWAYRIDPKLPALCSESKLTTVATADITLPVSTQYPDKDGNPGYPRTHKVEVQAHINIDADDFRQYNAEIRAYQAGGNVYVVKTVPVTPVGKGYNYYAWSLEDNDEISIPQPVGRIWVQITAEGHEGSGPCPHGNVEITVDINGIRIKDDDAPVCMVSPVMLNTSGRQTVSLTLLDGLSGLSNKLEVLADNVVYTASNIVQGTTDPVTLIFTQGDPTKSWLITLHGVDLAGNPVTCSADGTPPTFSFHSGQTYPYWTGLPYFEVDVQDTGSGLQSVTPSTNLYATVSVQPFVPGQTTPVQVIVSQQDWGAPYFGATLTATDMTGNTSVFKKRVKLDTVSPTCEWIDIPGNASSADLCLGVIRDTGGSGLFTMSVVSASDASVEIPFPSLWQGTSGPVTVTGTHTINDVPVSVSSWWDYTLRVTDLARNVTVCDPIVTMAVREDGKPVTKIFTNVPQAESKIKITNHTPGLKNLRIEINGTKFEIGGLRDGEVRDLDASGSMTSGNTITLTGLGKPGGSAGVLIHD